MDKQKILRSIPNMNSLLTTPVCVELINRYGKDAVRTALQEELEQVRKKVRAKETEDGRDRNRNFAECSQSNGTDIAKAGQCDGTDTAKASRNNDNSFAMAELDASGTGASRSRSEVAGQFPTDNQPDGWARFLQPGLISRFSPHMKRVINATGTILHTNLGRAPISEEHMKQILELACGYSNLEYDLETGHRGERYGHMEALLCRLTGAEAALVVNNNAASVLLILSALAKGREVLVSRGELIEIGGKFRIPDVCEQSGAILREVGTTNKTHPEDYQNAIAEETGMILKVHTSNYRIVGFTESVSLAELCTLGAERGIPVTADLGSGVLISLEHYGLAHEPTAGEAVAAGADLVCFSGDKLLGGPQAGIIVGKKKWIDQLKRHPLTRALRIDKFTAAALELTLREYVSEVNAVRRLPVLQMIARTEPELRRDALKLCRMLKRAKPDLDCSVVSCYSQIGGGALPLEQLPGAAVAIRPVHCSIQEAEKQMRAFSVPVICRCAKDRILLDVRTMQDRDFPLLVREFADCPLFSGTADTVEKA